MRSGRFVTMLVLGAMSACAASGAADPSADDGTLRGTPTAPPLDSGSLSACATATFEARRVPVYMLIVLDGSGSMVADSKWDSVTGALQSFFALSAVRADRGVAVGLTVFSDTGDATLGLGPYDSMDVPIGFVDGVQARALSTRIANAVPMYQTPMSAALVGQFPLLEAFKASGALDEGGKKVLVLMTDGVPYPDGVSQRPRVLDAVRAENARALTTFVVGIGSASPYDPTVYDPRFLAQVALAGGAARDDCDPEELADTKKMCHLQITPDDKTSEQLEAEFFTAISDVRSVIASCELSIDASAPDIDPSHANVVYVDRHGHETLLFEDATDGWTWDDPSHPSKVLLHGSACRALKAEPDGVVKVVVGCRTVIR